jgi:hypothetical protein
MIDFRRSVFFSEMSFFTAIIAFSFFSKSWALFLRFFLEVFFSFSKYRISLLIHFVGVFFLFLMLEIIMLILVSLFLRPFTEIVVKAGGYLD